MQEKQASKQKRCAE